MDDKVCRFHPDRQAVTRCTTCFKPLCPDCVLVAEGQDFCSRECADNCASHQARIEEFTAHAAADRKRRRFRKRLKFLFLLVVLALLGGLAWYFREQLAPLVDKVRQMIGN